MCMVVQKLCMMLCNISCRDALPHAFVRVSSCFRSSLQCPCQSLIVPQQQVNIISVKFLPIPALHEPLNRWRDTAEIVAKRIRMSSVRITLLWFSIMRCRHYRRAVGARIRQSTRPTSDAAKSAHHTNASPALEWIERTAQIAQAVDCRPSRE